MKHNKLIREIRRAYSQDELARMCVLPERELGGAFKMETVQTEPKYRYYRDDPEDFFYHFRDNGSSVLAVAHLDTVVAPKRRRTRFSGTSQGPLIVSGALDDRLGAYVILNLLPKLGVTCDWLLTTGEESGQSTAESFQPAKDYDWLIEFDRAGTDVVMYQYEDEPTCEVVRAAGAEVGIGSFSDIAFLEHLDVKAFNWGVGYRGNYHSEKGYAFLNDTFAMVAKYLKFAEQNKGITMAHQPGFSRHDDVLFDCDFCYARDAVDSVSWYCTICKTCQDCGQTEDEGCLCYAPGKTA